MGDESVGRSQEYLSIREAAERCGVPVRTMAKRAYLGEIEGAHKVRGPRGEEWRVPVAGLEAFGYQLPAERSVNSSEDAEVAALKRTAAAERNRAEEADRRLGHALLEGGRLRAQLAQEQARRQQAEDLAADLARKLADQVAPDGLLRT